jgi:hypothetical protein
MALISTTKGDIDESLLEFTEGGYENDNELQTFQQWTLEGEVVKRDVQLHLKKGLAGIPIAASM